MTSRIYWSALLFIPVLCFGQQDTGQSTPASPPPAKKATKTQRVPTPPTADEYGRTRIARDDTGYIESAFIQSLARVRFDAAFDDRNIDLANYFYSAGLTKNIAKLNFQEYHLKLEYALARRVSVFIDTPIRTLDPKVSYLCTPDCTAQTNVQTVVPANNTGFTGLSDLRAGLKLGLMTSPERQLTFQLATSIPTGNTNQGLGNGHNTIEPSLLYAQRLTDRVDIFGEFGDTHPIGGLSSFVFDPARSAAMQNFAADVVNYGLGASYGLLQHSRVGITPVLELVGWRVTGGLATIIAPGPGGQLAAYVVPPGTPPAFGSNIVNLKAGWRTSWGEHNSVYTGFGLQVSHAGWYRELLRLEYRYVFKRST